MFKFLGKIPKRLVGIVIYVAVSILDAKKLIDPATSEMGKAIGGGLAGIGFWHAQEKAKATATGGGGTGGTS